jgi:hypothetical protein
MEYLAKKNNAIRTGLNSLMEGWDEITQSTAIDCQFPYIYAKAYHYLQLGSVQYRDIDTMGQPPDDMTRNDLNVLLLGCKQVLEGRGFMEEYPFIDIGVKGFYNLFRLFHYTVSDKMTEYNYYFENQRGALDKMLLQHNITGYKVFYYNFVSFQ